MKKIKRKYIEKCNVKSDINEHLPTLLKYGKKCNQITEMGVRRVASTWSLLLAKPERMISYDILKDPTVNEVLNLAKEYQINYSFIEADVLKTEIEPTDLLFIDTLHTYGQLIQELNTHANKVLNYIILHDTVTYGFEDEVIYDHASDLIRNRIFYKQGLCPAIDDFLTTDEGKNWRVYKTFTNNNGLTILKRQIKGIKWRWI